MTVINQTSPLSSVRNALKILRLFSKQSPELGVTYISKQLQLSKSSVHRLISSLVEEGYLEKNTQTQRYRLGLSILGLSGIIMTHMEIHREAMPILKKLVDLLGESAQIGILENTHLVYIHKIDCNQPIHLFSSIGKLIPVHYTSSGKTILAFQSEETIQKVIEEQENHGQSNIPNIDEFKDKLVTIRQRGYDINMNEHLEDVVSIGAPIKDYTGEVVASVSVAGPTQRIKKSLIPYFIKQTIQAGQDISKALGYY